MRQPPVTSASAWAHLPELQIPQVENGGTKGATYRVVRVGFYPAARSEHAEGIQHFPVLPDGRRALSTITVKEHGKEKLMRLPWQLANWAFDMVALAQSLGSPFPSDVEFGIEPGGRYRAEIH